MKFDKQKDLMKYNNNCTTWGWKMDLRKRDMKEGANICVLFLCQMTHSRQKGGRLLIVNKFSISP